MLLFMLKPGFKTVRPATGFQQIMCYKDLKVVYASVDEQARSRTKNIKRYQSWRENQANFSTYFVTPLRPDIQG